MDPAASTGTCQACFREGLKMPKGNISKHGYKRPGLGYIIGACIGSHEAPYESTNGAPNSCEVTKRMRDIVKEYEIQQREELVRLQANPDTAPYVCRYYVPSTTGLGRHTTTILQVPKGAVAGFMEVPGITCSRSMRVAGDRMREAGEPLPLYHPHYEDALASAICRTEANISRAAADLKALAEKIQAFTPTKGSVTPQKG